MSNKKKCLMVLTTHNEEDRIERVLKYYTKFGEVVVVDNYSSDNTIKIAEKFCNKIIKFKNNGAAQTPDFYHNLIKEIGHPYIILLSCSEFIPEKLLHFFFNISLNEKYGLVRTVVDSYTCGENIKLWGGRFRFIDRKIERFFDLERLDINNIDIHKPYSLINKNDEFELDRKEDYVISHIRDSDTKSLIIKHLGYADVEADSYLEKGNPMTIFSLLKLMFKEMLRFFQLPLKHMGFVAQREIMARVAMHFFIFFISREKKNEKGINYSKTRSQKLWNDFQERDKGE